MREVDKRGETRVKKLYTLLLTNLSKKNGKKIMVVPCCLPDGSQHGVCPAEDYGKGNRQEHGRTSGGRISACARHNSGRCYGLEW